MNAKIEALREYFQGKDNVLLAFLFGSRAKKQERQISDWDIAVYFTPKEYLEIETEIEYPDELKIWSDLITILGTDDVDFLVLNRARPVLVYNVLRTGKPLIIKDRELYLDLLCKVSYEAMDWWDFVEDYWKIREKSKSLLPEEKTKIKERLVFLEEQFEDIERFKNLDWVIYRDDRNERRNVERWIENLVMSALDIAKIILAANGEEIPQSYKDTLKVFIGKYIDFSVAEKFSEFALLRNILVHEYLDIKWKRIKNFIEQAEMLYPILIKKIKQILEETDNP